MRTLTSDVFRRNRMSSPAVLALGIVVVHVMLGAAATWLSFGSTSGPGAEPLFTLVYVPFVLMGAIVVARHPRNPVGWLLAFVGFSANLGFFVQEYAIRSTVVAPGSLPGGPFFAWVSFWIWNASLMSLFYAVLLFPTGRPASPRWRPLAWVAGLLFALFTFVFAFTPGADDPRGLVNPFAIEELRLLGVWLEDSFWVFLLVFGLAVSSVIARFRASRGVERQQLKWAAGGCAFAAALLAISNYAPSPLSDVGWILALPAIPVSFAIAMLRYRLYDIDVLINRTLVYGAVTALLAATYFGGVVLIQALLRPFTSGSELAVAASTLLVVALFQPLRRRVQDAVDRRFYRSRYDAARTLDAFAARLRNEVELDAVRADLLGVVAETIRPVHASVWLRRS